ncbi:hypothetical protein EIP86_002003 [Pleurotus ostreatoroseus]|nr:hypothetical protein EIP86_002003 [Pleurotus ostreatoroseus]
MLSNRDLLSLLQTCKTLLLTGAQELAGRPYSFELPARSRSLDDFYSLLHVAEHISFPALRRLTIKSGLNLTRDSGVLCLEWLLYGARHLCVLNIDANLLELRDCYVPWTIWTMKELKVLRIGGITAAKMTKQVLQELHSPLECLIVSFRPLNKTCLACLLAKFRNTIREAIIEGPSFLNGCHSREPFLNLTRLSLSRCYQARLSVLVPMFPNIQVLKLMINDSGFPKGLDLDRIRSENIKYQKEGPAPVWPSLKVLVVSKSALHLLAIQREMDSVVLAWPIVLEQEDDIACLEKSLAPLRPKHLKIQMKHSLSGLMRAIVTCIHRLERLDITVQFTENSPHNTLVSYTFHESSAGND